MITITDLHKRFWRRGGEPHWVLRGVSLSFPADRNVGIIGVNGAGKSTLLRLISGVEAPTLGTIRCDTRVSWPIGLSGGMQRMLTGRQNARFMCRIHGFGDDVEERMRFVEDFTKLGAALDEPVWTYSSGMRGRLNFALSLAFDFDIYLVDEMMGAGDVTFKEKSRKAIQDLASRAAMIIVSHSEGTIKRLCQSVVWLHEGRALWYDSPREGLRDYHRYATA